VEAHGSIARNPRICEALFLTDYIEKYGTGTLMMIRESLAHAVPEPDFAQRGGEFTIAVWRDWVTEKVLAGYNLNDRKQRAIQFLKAHGSITNSQYQREFSVAKRTASLDLADLVSAGLVEKEGSTGRGVQYRMAKGAAKGQKGQSSCHESAKPARRGARASHNGSRIGSQGPHSELAISRVRRTSKEAIRGRQGHHFSDASTGHEPDKQDRRKALAVHSAPATRQKPDTPGMIGATKGPIMGDVVD
jgi:ATP-dependent DNA helicase RecG